MPPCLRQMTLLLYWVILFEIYDHLPLFLLISDVVHLSGTYLILLIRIRLYLCRLDYILSMFLLYLLFRMFLLSSFGTPYCSSFIVLFRDIPFVPQWTIVLYHNRQSRLSL